MIELASNRFYRCLAADWIIEVDGAGKRLPTNVSAP
jgi:hypothetical protein